MGLVPYKRDPRLLPSPFYLMRTQWEEAIYEPAREPSSDSGTAMALIVDLPASRTARINFCL
jgi:hypothetical protein